MPNARGPVKGPRKQQEESKRLELARFLYSSTIDTLFNEQDIFAFKQNRFTVQTFDYDPSKVIVKYLPTQKVDSVNCVKAFLNSDKYEFTFLGVTAFVAILIFVI